MADTDYKAKARESFEALKLRAQDLEVSNWFDFDAIEKSDALDDPGKAFVTLVRLNRALDVIDPNSKENRRGRSDLKRSRSRRETPRHARDASDTSSSGQRRKRNPEGKKARKQAAKEAAREKKRHEGRPSRRRGSSGGGTMIY